MVFTIESTMRYAKKDTDVLDLYLELANKFVKQQVVDLSELKNMFYDRQISKIEKLREVTVDV